MKWTSQMITQQCRSIDEMWASYSEIDYFFFLSLLVRTRGIVSTRSIRTLEFSPDLGYLGHSIFEWVLACTLVWFTFVSMVHTKNCSYCDEKTKIYRKQMMKTLYWTINYIRNSQNKKCIFFLDFSFFLFLLCFFAISHWFPSRKQFIVLLSVKGNVKHLNLFIMRKNNYHWSNLNIN